VVICPERGADLHMAQLMPLQLTVSCFSKIQIGFTFLVPAHPGSREQRAIKQLCVCVCCFDAVHYCSTCLAGVMPGRLWHLFVSVVACDSIERVPVDRKVGIGRRPHSHSLLQVVEANVAICSLPAQVQTPADYVGIVHQTDPSLQHTTC